MKLSKWAKANSVTYRTAWGMFKAGNIPGAYKLATGTIVVPEAVVTNKPPLVVTYARVSSAENKDNLRAQSARLVAFCNAKGWQTHQNIQEVGSGLNDKRPKLLKVLSDGLATKLVVEHKDRLARFGVRYVEALCKHVGCELVVINEAETDEADLVQDFTSIITSFCARVYGLRRSKRKTEQLIAALANKGSA
jgi:predicted site-specific integrase-resolvase